MNWEMNTNFEAAYREILKDAKAHNVEQKDMPEYILVLSDMQFDQSWLGVDCDPYSRNSMFGGNNEIEGELVCNKTLEYLPDFEKECVYSSQTDISAKNIRKALGKGGMFMHLHGHGSPLMWTSHKPLNFDEWEDGLFISDVPLFFNKEYPILICSFSIML